ncbi:MAG: HepT-like ribonuclease domain-containing protein [Candidatus Sulfotelmatobacter sp.]
MAARSLEERLQDIRQAAIDLRDFIADMETAAFHALPHADRMGFRAVKNALTELGEAAKAIPEETRARYPDVDWKGFAGLRDMMAHQYFGIDTRMLLPIVRDEIPALLRAVECELQELDLPSPAGR